MDNIDSFCKICKVSFWEWDIANNKFNEFGYFGSHQGNLESFLAKVYSPDRTYLEDNIHEFAHSKLLFEKTIRIHLDPSTIKWIFIRGQVQPENPGKMLGTFMGVNDWKKNEDNRFLRQRELMELMHLNSHNGVISLLTHELTQPLMVINTYLSGCLYRLKENKIDHSQLIPIIEIIKQHALQVGDKIHELKDFVNESRLENHETNIHDVIQESISLLFYELQTIGIKLTYDYQENLPVIKMDKIQIKQVIYNLIKNTIENMETGITSLAFKTKKINEKSIKVTIKNDGQKNSPKTHDKTLATDLNKYHGLKMGLEICRSIIEAHGGTLMVKTSPKGKHYQFTLHG